MVTSTYSQSVLMPKRLFWALLPLLLIPSIPVIGQDQPSLKVSEIGTPVINIYTPDVYGAHEQSFDIAQDERGVLYFANNSGIIEFDGKRWLHNMDESGDSYYDVVTASDGKIFGLTKSEIGYWYPAPDGSYLYQSLLPKLPSDLPDLGNSTSIELMGDHIIFASRKHFMSYDIKKDTVMVYKAKNWFGQPSVIDDKAYIRDWPHGLVVLEDEAFTYHPFPADSTDMVVTSILKYSEEELLIVSWESGLFLYDFNELRPFKTEVSELYENNQITIACWVGEDYIAIGTVKSGIHIIDKQGKLIQKLDASTGLPDARVSGLFVDQNMNLWATQDGYISQIILNSPFLDIDERHGLKGFQTYLYEHQGNIYVGTPDGISYKGADVPWQKPGEHKPFVSLEGIQDNRGWMFMSKGPDLFALTGAGVGQITDNRYVPLYEGSSAWAGVMLKNSEGLVFGQRTGDLHLIQKKSGRWQYISQIKGFNHQMDFLERTENDEIWLTDSETGVFKLTLNAAQDSVVKVRTYGKEDGLPDVQGNRVFRHNDKLYFTTRKGVYRYSQASDTFLPDSAVNKHIGEYYIGRFAMLTDDKILATMSGLGLGMLVPKNEEYEIVYSPFQAVNDHTPEFITSLNSNKAWIVGPGIKYIDPAQATWNSLKTKTLVRQVNILNKGDSLIYGGSGMQADVQLNVKENAVRFRYAAPLYEHVNKVEFQSYLEGFEETWASWSSESNRDYTNLPHGIYTFKVRARDHYGRISETAEYNFTIITPWYFTWWAYALYGVLAILLVWLIVKLNLRRVEKEKESLEQTVQERTEEIRIQKDEIEEQANRLRELDKVKSRFFANISHELRTPLTLINAPLESLVHNGKIEDPEVRETLETATRNGVSLLSLVEEILDLAKLDGGKLKLIENPVRVDDFLKLILSDYKSGLDHKSINLNYEYKAKANLAILIDENRCTKVVNNLLSNALKFTPEEGEICVLVTDDATSGRLKIEVSDTGIGIHPNDLPYVFDRYYQSEQPGKKAEGGTGIGLALAKELTELHGGSLTVTSELNRGTSFVFELPMKEVQEETIVPLSLVEDKALGEALQSTIERYAEKFEVDKPVLLVTEDHPEMRAFIAKTLSPYFAIRQAENGKVALEVLNSERIDIVISDVMMPVMDGFELLEEIKKNESLHQVSLIMLTARADHEDKLYALTLGIDDYLTKPFSATEFLARIKNILENRIKIIRELNAESTKEDLGLLIKRYQLVEREVEVLKLMAQRLSNPEIAEALFISRNTVKFHIKNIFGKMGLKTRAQAIELIKTED